MSNIEWTDEAWNPVIGCTPVSPGCLNCYAARMALRMQANPQTPEYHARLGVDGQGRGGQPIRIAEVRGDRPVFTGEVRCLPDRLAEPMKWRKPRRVFVNSMSDLFHEAVPFEFIDRVFAVMALCPQHTFQVLTKRPERMAEYLTEREDGGLKLAASVRDIVGRSRGDEWVSRTEEAVRRYDNARGVLPNVWLGTSVENQKAADERIPHLLQCPAAVRFLSCEPLLGPVDVDEYLNTGLMRCTSCGSEQYPIKESPVCNCPDEDDDEGRGPPFKHWVHVSEIDWIIVGGESGPKARPCDVAWIESIVAQCREAGVACFVKQLGANVVCRNDEVSDWMDQPGGPCLDDINTEGVTMQGDPVRVRLHDRKGGDPAEWPEHLRVREFPKV